MFSSSIYSAEKLDIYPKAIKKALNYVKDNFEELQNLDTGIYEIDGKNIFMQIIDTKTEHINERKIESHKKYIDVQVLLKGKEILGFCPYKDGFEVLEEIEERDIIFYRNVDNETFIKAEAGCYNIFFPNDIHRPGVIYDEAMDIKKAVIKVLYSLI